MEFVISHLAKSYGKHQVLKDVDYSFEEGKIYGLLGRNGAGKTTLFNCLNSDIDFERGSFYFVEEGLQKEITAGDIGYVLSTPTVPDFLTGREFLRFFMDIHKDEIKDPRTIDEYMDYVHIPEDTKDRLMKDYSHGTKNKMQMLINIVAAPKLILLDEPLTSLDVVVAEEMKDILRKQKDGRVLIFSTHLLDIAVDLCDEIVLLNHGRLEPVDRENLDNGDFMVKNHVYIFFNIFTGFFYVAMIFIPMDALILTVIMLVITVPYILISRLLIRKFGPKTFRVK